MKTLTYVYTYHSGGWGDMIKGLHMAWCWAHGTGRTLRINFKVHIFGKIFPQHNWPIEPITIDAIDKLGLVNIEHIRAFHDKENISVCCNWFNTACIGPVNPLPFYDEVYTSLFPLEFPDISGAYHVLHCRIGDKYLSEAYACKNDNRIGTMSRITDILPFYNALNHPRTLVCGDNTAIIGHLLKVVPNSFTLCPKPYHIAYQTDDIEYRIPDICAMIQEHRAITLAESITMMSYSGFPISAALFKNKPLFIYRITERKPYTDDLVESIQKFYS